MLLTATELSVTLSGDDGEPVRILDAVGLRLTGGEIVDVVGPSGSGKTTLLRALARLLPVGSGSLQLEGTAAEDISPQTWRTRIALLPQKPATVAGTIRENLLLPWRLKVRVGEVPPEDAALSGALADVGMETALDRDASRLSVGQHARVALVRVMLARPDVLLLDEPDAALDDASAASVAAGLRSFAERGGGVVRVRHRSPDGLAHRRLHLERGRLEEVAP